METMVEVTYREELMEMMVEVACSEEVMEMVMVETCKELEGSKKAEVAV